MPVYEYTALNAKGKKAKGIIDADSTTAARQKLRGSSIFPIAIDEVHSATAPKEARKISLGPLAGRIRPADVTMMTRQLSTLINAGFPLVQALDSLLPLARTSVLKKSLAKLKDSVVEGKSFAQALGLFPSTFTNLYRNMVKAGESSGTLEIVLERLADVLEKQQQLKNKITSALAYPILLALFGAAVLFFLMAHIVPSITSIFTDMGQALPTPTVVLIALSETLQSYAWLIPIIFVLLFGAFALTKRTTNGRYLIDKLKLALPVMGPLLCKYAVARFSRTLGSLLENGVTLLAALDIVKNISGNVLFAEATDSAIQDVSKGQPLATSLGKFKFFPPLATQMIQVGEQSGALEEMLYKIADVYENEMEANIMRMTSLLEPIMIVVMGVVMGFIILSICLPIFEMNQLVR
jgi:general secretion pathway protein F